MNERIKMQRFRVHYLVRDNANSDWEENKHDVTVATVEDAKAHIKAVVERGRLVQFGKVKILREERWGVR